MTQDFLPLLEYINYRRCTSFALVRDLTRVRVVVAAPVVKRVVKPSGPVFGKIGPLSKKYDPKDFEAAEKP